MKEIAIEAAVTAHAEANGWLVRKVVYAGRRGAPDRWFVKDGRWVLVEFKRPGHTFDPHQDKEARRLAEHGVTVHLIDDVAAGKRLFG